MEQSKEELIGNFRKAFKALDDKDKVIEVERLYRIIKKKPVIVLEDYDLGKALKFLNIQDLIDYLYFKKGIRADKSFLYKTLKGGFESAYGFAMYYLYEENL
jgi:uncharacterized radical SAM superfamily Fe-S cluster-containing enzyme